MDDQVWTNVRIVLLSVGGIMVGMGLGGSKTYQAVMLLAGAITVIGPAIWGIYAAIQRARQKRIDQAKAVSAGIHLALSPELMTKTDETGKVVPVPVTQASAAEIVKNFAPTEVPKVA